MGDPDEDSQSRRRTDSGPAELAETFRVLAVDDDPAYLRYLSLILRRAGFHVEVAEHGLAAIERLRTPPPIDILVVDLAMPDIDGIETVNRIQREINAPALYTVLLTASTAAEVKLRALDAGLDDFLTKASSDSEIVAKLRSAARRVQIERRLAHENEELQELALTDELTGIANRRALLRTGEQLVKSGRPMTVVLLDLEKFKHINDTLGHFAGDRVLHQVAAVLKANSRLGDVIGRYGGDEFVLLLPDTSVQNARMMARRIVSAIRQPMWNLSAQPVRIGAQTGIAAFPGEGSTLNELLAVCDKRLYRAKRARGSRNDDAEDRPVIR